MITDSQTNHVFLSNKLLERKVFYNHLTEVLNESKVQFNILPNTNDIWCVDYMPIQVDINKFIQFTYSPGYLQTKKWIHTQTDPNVITNNLNIRTKNSYIKLDGGNVIKGNNWVILTEKVYTENKAIDKVSIINELEQLFGVRVIIIPKEPYEITGHADGILRYYKDDTVLINDYPTDRLQNFQNRLMNKLNKEGLKTIKVPNKSFANVNYDSATGLYINFLHMSNFILLPSFGIKEDEEVVRQFEQLYPSHTIRTIVSNDISKDGGVLNCITWNIRVK
ncbi:MAG TPA: agmatine deiminase family protein [Cyclobacteriaceae bacterium]|nr:agmatine deiminase family protein [Cyclobacteriaceae bacterium]